MAKTSVRIPVDRLFCTTPIPQTSCAWLWFEQDYSGTKESFTHTWKYVHVRLVQDMHINHFHYSFQKQISEGGQFSLWVKPYQPDHEELQ